MIGLSEYKLYFLQGADDFVLKELLDKYPDTEIMKENKSEIVFKNKETNIEEFRNLYSPTHIEDSNGKILNLSKREWRKEYVPAGINPSLAYILCMIADLNKEDIVYDPFCGASVIPITALKYFNVKRVICSDIKDVTLNKRNVDKIISNLPFGIRVGEHSDNVEIYKSLEVLANRLLRTKGMLVLLTQEKKLLREVFSKESWNVKSVLRVNEGGLLPEVFVIKRSL